jgi:hypothetical protein
MQKKASFAYAIENNRLWDRQMVDYWHVTCRRCCASVNAARDLEGECANYFMLGEVAGFWLNRETQRER